MDEMTNPQAPATDVPATEPAEETTMVPEEVATEVAPEGTEDVAV